MKLLREITLLAFLFILAACSQPIGSSLLVSGSSASSDTTGIIDDDEDTNAVLEIRADNRDVSANLEDTDKIEISGSCNDLDRRNNRIFVEVFSSEQTTDLPYIQNTTSDQCLGLSTAGGSTGNGTNVGDTCFFVTKGAGFTEIDGPIQRSFPQCHNGRFSFAVRLGAELSNNSLAAGRRYKVRMKLSTLGQVPPESSWEEVNVTRKLSAPTIEKVTPNADTYTCSVDMLPARFNSNIKYTLLRSQVGVNTVAAFPLLSNIDSTDTRAYNVVNSSLTASASTSTDSTRIIAGSTYSYTLQSQDSTVYSGGFSYITPLTTASSAVTCEVPRPTVTQLTPTNNVAFGPSCFFAMNLINPSLSDGTGFVSLRWAYSTVKGWTGTGHDYSGTIPSATVPTGRISICTNANCTTDTTPEGGALEDPLVANVTYYYAVQEVDNTTGLSGKWSDEIECKPPSL